jgi:LmbE family N-acetylglucosaminyl deacetylase
MTKRVLVVAPHPDDETLGCGGTLMRLHQQGAELAWLIVTGISEEYGWTAERVQQRDEEIDQVAKLMGFSEVFNLQLPTTRLDTLSMQELINQFSVVFKAFEPEQLFLPNRSDAHTDHRVVYDAAAACTKWFRYPSIRRVLAYETLSETGFGIGAESVFDPNYFVDITGFLERKLHVMAVYQSELGTFPFPRSVEAIRALAAVRGVASGFVAAEAFQLLRERL